MEENFVPNIFLAKSFCLGYTWSFCKLILKSEQNCLHKQNSQTPNKIRYIDNHCSHEYMFNIRQEFKIKSTMRYHFTLTRITKIKNGYKTKH